MTREEAKDKMLENLYIPSKKWAEIYNIVEYTVDSIYDSFEEAMKPKTCDGCKFRNTVKFVQVESETLECCSVCVRNCYDYYEPKDNA